MEWSCAHSLRKKKGFLPFVTVLDKYSAHCELSTERGGRALFSLWLL